VLLEQIDKLVAPAGEVISAEILRLAEMLAELGLISADHPGKVRVETAQIEVKHPEPRLYGFDGADTVVATRKAGYRLRTAL
jgi:hypothetical protein